MKKKSRQHYYLGGIADLAPHPSVLTYSFFAHWLTTAKSTGKAMEFLGLPYLKSTKPLLVSINGELAVDLAVEEECLYKQTLLGYANKGGKSEPKLRFQLSKLGKWECVLNTGRVLARQTRWIRDPKTVIKQARELVDGLDERIIFRKISEADMYLAEVVWPRYIAIDYWLQFYSQLVIKEMGGRANHLFEYTGEKLIEKDWVVRSILDQSMVKLGKLSWKKYWQQYGMRSDKDFELDCPRWNERKRDLNKRVKDLPVYSVNKKLVQIEKKYIGLAETVVELSLARSRVRKCALVYIDKLRKLIIGQEGKRKNIAQMTREELLDKKAKVSKNPKGLKKRGVRVFEEQIGINPGKVAGRVELVDDLNYKSQSYGEIGVIPHLGPEFVPIYRNYKGLVFLRGAENDSGAVLIRNWGIPAIVNHKVEGLKYKDKIRIDGSSGEWKKSKS